MQTYFENDFITIGYDKINHLIVHTWIVPPTSDEFREGLNSLIPAMEFFKTGNIITDTTNLGIIYPDDRQWAVADWFQSALKVGYSQLAVITPDYVFTLMLSEDAMRQASLIQTAYFDNMEAAIDWIKKSRH